MKENQKKSFDFAADTVKQLITLSTAIVTLTVTFSKEIIGINADYPKSLLAWTWGVFIASLFFGILALMALTGSLQPINHEKKSTNGNPAKQRTEKENEVKEIIDAAALKGYKLEETMDDQFSINNGSIRLFASLQILAFITGIIMTVIFGYKLLAPGSIDNHKGEYMIIRETKLVNDSATYIDTLYLPQK